MLTSSWRRRLRNVRTVASSSRLPSQAHANTTASHPQPTCHKALMLSYLSQLSKLRQCIAARHDRGAERSHRARPSVPSATCPPDPSAGVLGGIWISLYGAGGRFRCINANGSTGGTWPKYSCIWGPQNVSQLHSLRH